MSDDNESAIVQSGKGRLGEEVSHPEIVIDNPGWVRRQIDWTRLYFGDRDRMRVALLAATRNVEQRTGGPFGAAVFESATGRLIAVGVDMATENSTLLHAETAALAMSQRIVGARLDLAGLELHTSCEPCLMCVGAIMLSRIPRVVSSMTAADAAAVGFGDAYAPAPVWLELERRGVEIVRDVLRDEGRDVFRLCRAARGRPSGE